MTVKDISIDPAIPASGMSGWRPIETRPTSDDTYLICNAKGQVAPFIAGVIHNNTGNAGDWTYGENTTHWMPLPPPPGAAPDLMDGAGEQALGMYAVQADEIKALLDEHAPYTTGNIKTRIAQLLLVAPPSGDMRNSSEGADSLEANVKYLLDNCPFAVRDLSGDRTGMRGREDLAGSLAITFLGMQAELKKARATPISKDAAPDGTATGCREVK